MYVILLKIIQNEFYEHKYLGKKRIKLLNKIVILDSKGDKWLGTQVSVLSQYSSGYWGLWASFLWK